MLFLIGVVVVLSSVIGGYTMHHGNLAVLWQPNEFIIIIGAALVGRFISNLMKVVKGVGKSLKLLLKGIPTAKQATSNC